MSIKKSKKENKNSMVNWIKNALKQENYEIEKVLLKYKNYGKETGSKSSYMSYRMKVLTIAKELEKMENVKIIRKEKNTDWVKKKLKETNNDFMLVMDMYNDYKEQTGSDCSRESYIHLVRKCSADSNLNIRQILTETNEQKREEKLIEGIITRILKKPSTINELSMRFKLPEDNIKNVIKKIEKIYKDRYTIYNIKRMNGEHILTAQVDNNDAHEWRKFKERKFKIHRQPNGQPYLWVKIESKFTEIKVVPMADLHYGSVEFDEKLFQKFIDWVENDDRVYLLLLGDLIENSNKSSIADGVFRQNLTPTDQCIDVCKRLAPVQHKILGIVRGNHEKRTVNSVGLDPSEFIAHELDLPYYKEPTYIDLFFGNQVFTFRYEHGRGGSQTEGGKINSAMKSLPFTNHINFYLSGHLHDSKSLCKMRLVLNRENFKIEQKKQYIGICNAFLKYFGGYGSESGYAPPSTDFMVCKIRKDGEYFLTS